MENDDEKVIDYLEKYIPEMAQAAVKQAYWHALASGSSVLVGETVLSMKCFPTARLNSLKALRLP